MQNYDYLKDADFLKLLDQEHNKFYWVKNLTIKNDRL